MNTATISRCAAVGLLGEWPLTSVAKQTASTASLASGNALLNVDILPKVFNELGSVQMANSMPTASTTAQMALGDALAVALLALRGFSAADFAKFHPGGALGKQLYLRVSDLYTQHGRPVVRDTDTLPQILLEISAQRLGATAVLDADDQLLGIITDGDLRRMLAHNKMEINHLTAKDILTPAPQCIHSEALAVDALALLRQHSITQLVVIDAETSAYVGMIHVHDLVREGLI